MNDEDFLSCLGYNLTDTSTPCPSDSGIDLSSMELDLWSLNCGNNLSTLQRIDSSLFKGDLTEISGKTFPMESSEMFPESSANLTQSNSHHHHHHSHYNHHHHNNSHHHHHGHHPSYSPNGANNSRLELRNGLTTNGTGHYMNSDSSYYNQYGGSPSHYASSKTVVPPSASPFSQNGGSPSRSSTPISAVNTNNNGSVMVGPLSNGGHLNSSGSSFSSQSVTNNNTSINSISYSFHPNITMNQCNSGSGPSPAVLSGSSSRLPHHPPPPPPPPPPPHHSMTSASYLPPPTHGNGQFAVAHPTSGLFPTSMSVNLSMNMTMDFGSPAEAAAAAASANQPITWSSSGLPNQSGSGYGMSPVTGGSPVNGRPSNITHCSGVTSSPTLTTINSTSSGYYDAVYNSPYPSPSPPPTAYHHYSVTGETRASDLDMGQQSQPVDDSPLPGSGLLDKEYEVLRVQVRSCSPLSERSQNDINLRFNYHKGKIAQELAAIQEMSQGSDDASCEGKNGSSSSSSSPANLCRICGKTYARPSTLKTHLRTHSGERPYRCSTCNKSFSQAANLTAHIRTHSGEKPFRCPVCDRRFSQSSSVTTHMRTHSGERPYRCCMCKKAFSDSSTLTKHLRIHSGEKPYQCKLCLLRFSQSGNLNRHMRIHSNIT